MRRVVKKRNTETATADNRALGARYIEILALREAIRKETRTPQEEPPPDRHRALKRNRAGSAEPLGTAYNGPPPELLTRSD